MSYRFSTLTMLGRPIFYAKCYCSKPCQYRSAGVTKDGIEYNPNGCHLTECGEWIL